MSNIKDFSREYPVHNAHKRMEGGSGNFPVKSINKRNLNGNQDRFLKYFIVSCFRGIQ
jgi:hypothetical protein